MERKNETDAKMWFEVFSEGDIWVLHKFSSYLFGKKTYLDVSDFYAENLVDNGIFDFEERARLMDLKAVRVN